METSVKQRLIEFIKYKDLSQRKFEQLVGLSNGFVNNISKGIGADKMLKILGVFPELNQRWLLYNEGDMLQKNEALPRTMDVIVGIPLVSQYAYAGYLSGYGDPEYIDKLPRIDFTPDRHMTGNYIAFEVRGDSMNDGSTDSYLEGELLICREVEPVYWKDSQLFINKRDFVIIHKEGILIKRIIAHDVENHTITIHSLNPMYQDEVLDLADVRQIFSVVESRRQRRR
jgi:phage repressor protein C with HTH and peptisase S24 domain